MNTEDTHDVVEIKKDNELSTENITVQTKVLTVKQDRTYNSFCCNSLATTVLSSWKINSD